MTTLAILVLVASVLLWMRSKNERARALRVFKRVDHVADDQTIIWRLDFVDMMMIHHVHVYPPVPDVTYHVRRQGSASWEMKLTKESFQAAADEAQRKLEPGRGQGGEV